MDLFYIYKITNNLNGKTYIGQHKYNSEKYSDDYKSLINDGYWGSGILINRAYEKHGLDNFTKDILVSHLECKEIADDAEKHFIKCYKDLSKAEYNIADGGIGGNYGEEVNKRISAANKGRRHSEEHNRKISEARKGKPCPESVKQKIAEKLRGIHLSEDTKRKVSESLKGNKRAAGIKHTDEWKKANSERMKGRHWFNNGEKQVLQFECPNGFVPGQLKR